MRCYHHDDGGLWYWFRSGAAVKSRSGLGITVEIFVGGLLVAAGIMQLIPLKKKFMLEEQSSSLE